MSDPHGSDASLSKALRIARAGAAHALSGFRAGTVVEKKGEIDLVTRFDREVERLVRDGLAEAFPGDAIVGEEEDPTGSSSRVWYVDPIDGTTNFAHGHPFFCVSMGLAIEGTPTLGVIVAPALGLEWTGFVGGGVWRNGLPCHVSTTDDLGDALVATGFAYDRWRTEDDNLGEHDAFVKSTRGVRRCGAAALDLALVADGTYDAYWEQSLKAWDVGAGMALVIAAGGRVTDYVGEATSVTAGQVVASNGRLHDATLALLGDARRKRGLDPAGLRRDVLRSAP